MTFPGNTVSNVVANFTIGNYLFITGSTVIATVIGYSVAYPRRVKGVVGFANALIASTGSFLVSYVKTDNELTQKWRSDLNKELEMTRRMRRGITTNNN